ncbi:MAG: DNA alkylation repair protein [Candidatus Bathyarchaeota archaeon]|nr:DNA alkylation repair protein [Candidatus Bathyarchaeota archaeon]
MSASIVEEIRAELRRRASTEGVEKARRFFREPIEVYGLSTSQEMEIVKRFYPQVKGDLPLALEVAGKLVESRVLEEASIGVRLLKRMTRLFTPELFEVFDEWVDHLTNWANTDGLSTWLISETVRLEPGLTERLLRWTESENRWRRRAAVVSFVPIARRGEMLEEVFKIADRLMTDGDDMVQKGVGWLLKEASREHPDEVRDYLLRWRELTSALVLRYASEKLPREMRVLKTK